MALVTGAGAGIGRAVALELARRCATVAVHYHKSADGARTTVAEIVAGGGRAAEFGGDLTRAEEVKGLVAAVLARFERVDVLVNNAGDLIERKPLAEMSEELFRRVIDVNLTSAFLCCRAVAPSMIARRSGAIVNMSSLAAHNGGGPGAFAYAAAKGAVLSFTRGIAKELAPHGVRVNGVAPGLIGQTAFHGRFTPPAAFESIEKTIPLARAGTPEEVARVVAFLAGEDAAYLVGETVEVNGGVYLR